MNLELDELLRLRPAWCQTTLASIGDGVIVTDTEGKISFINSVAESMTGWVMQDAHRQPIDRVFKLIDEGNGERIESPTARVLRDGVVVGLGNHSLLVDKNNGNRPVDHTASPIRNDKDEIRGAVLIFRDVSERRRQELRVDSALAYAENIITTLREPFLVLSKSLHVLSANGAFYRNFHVSKAETEGHLIFDLGNGQWNIPRLRILLAEVVSNADAVHNFEVEHEFPAIGSKTMLLNAARFGAADGSDGLILLAIDDITEHRRAEVAIQTSESRYRRLFQTAKDGILIIDIATQRIVDANAFMLELLGYSYDEIVGKELWQLGFLKDKTASQVAFRELEAKGYIRYEHLSLETKTGGTAEVEFVSNVYRDGVKKVAQCNIRDISARSRLERQMQDQADALSDLHRRKDEFLAMLSHELRNPLAPILNAVLLLRLQGRDNPIQQQAVGIIDRQVGQLRHIIDDLLEVSRITTGRVQLRQEVITAGGVALHAIETARPLIEPHKHVLTVAIAPEPIYLHADGARLEQVIVNLLTNAAKYTNDNGHIWLTVAQEGDECVIRVRDNGVGIPPDILPNIFELFTQAERSLDRSQGGLGIGLALAHRLVEMHEGRIEATSALGMGSEFIVRLPVVARPSRNTPAASMPNARLMGQSLRVLVVEDNVDTARSFAMLLEASGHDVRTVHDGQAALEAALEYRPNAVLLDIGLPGLDGYKVAKWMRHTLPDVMLIAVTGYGQEADRQRSQQAGFNHHLVKPADFENVLQILATVPASAT